MPQIKDRMAAMATMLIAKQIVFTFVALVLAWGALELAALAYWWIVPLKGAPYIQFHYQPHPYRAYAPVPVAKFYPQDAPFNAQGLRGPEVALQKPPDVIRIVCLGGSTTFNPGATTGNHAYPARMQDILQRRYEGTRVRFEVLNAGVPASVSMESLIYFETRLLDFSPDIAIFHHAMNDAWMMFCSVNFKSDYSNIRKTLLIPQPAWWEHSPLLSLLLPFRSVSNPYCPRPTAHLLQVTLKGPLRMPRPEGWPGLDRAMLATFERNVRSFVCVARGNGVIPVLATQVYHPQGWIHEVGNKAVRQLNDLMRKIAARQSVALIDFAKKMQWSAEAFYDPVHLRDKPEGLGRKARIFADSLVEQGVIQRAIERHGRRVETKGHAR